MQYLCLSILVHSFFHTLIPCLSPCHHLNQGPSHLLSKFPEFITSLAGPDSSLFKSSCSLQINLSKIRFHHFTAVFPNFSRFLLSKRPKSLAPPQVSQKLLFQICLHLSSQTTRGCLAARSPFSANTAPPEKGRIGPWSRQIPVPPSRAR